MTATITTALVTFTAAGVDFVVDLDAPAPLADVPAYGFARVADVTDANLAAFVASSAELLDPEPLAAVLATPGAGAALVAALLDAAHAGDPVAIDALAELAYGPLSTELTPAELSTARGTDRTAGARTASLESGILADVDSALADILDN